MDDYKLRGKVHAPFGPMLIEFTIPQPYVDMFNKYSDSITKSEKKSKQLDHSDELIGNVKQEHKIEDHLWQEKPKGVEQSFFTWVANCSNTYIKAHLQHQGDAEDNKTMANKNIQGLNLHNSWIVNQVAGDFNPPHMHSGALSAAGWLMVPESIEKGEEREEAGWIEWLFADPHPFVNPKYPFKPQVGKVMFFPSWLQHQVYPFRGKGIRRSISFNVTPKFK